jgi:predicted O-methyltransferase YrrM
VDIVDPRIEEYASAHTTAPVGQLAAVALATRKTMPSPGMMSGQVEARLFEALIVVAGARRALEVGTFTGFGALTMAAALPDDGEVVTIEKDEGTAAIARDNFDSSEHGSKVRLIVGDAREELAKLDGPFDFVYIDAWKSDYPAYYEATIPLLSPRGILVADNVLRSGRVLDPEAEESVRVTREFNARVHADERVHNALLTVGDGLMLAWLA